MEYARMRDNSSSPHPTENSAEPLIQTDSSLATLNGGGVDAEDQARPSPPPSTINFRHIKELLSFTLLMILTLSRHIKELLPRPKPLFRGFEIPSFTRLVILTLTCAIAYPAFYALTLVAKDRALFIVRLLVAVWCSGIKLALQYPLDKIGVRHREASSEFTSVGYQDFLKLSFDQPGMRWFA